MKLLPNNSEVVLRYFFERHAEEQPTKECIYFENGERWTFKQALLEAYAAAKVLSRHGIKRGDRVMIFLPNNQGWIRAWWGINFLGAIVLPINNSYKGGMLKYICRDSQSRHIIISPDMARNLEGLKLDLNIIDPILLADGPADPPEPDEPLGLWDIAMIVYTGGTTGPSKGVLITYFQLFNNIQSYRGTTAEDTVLVDAPLFHIAGVACAYPIWSVGGRVALRTKFTGSHYFDVVRECGATVATLVGTTPAFLEASPEKPDDADNPLRILGCSPMVRDPARFMERFGIQQLITYYGATETFNVLINRDPTQKPKSCGKPAEWLEVRIVDPHDIPVPAGEVGELIVRSEVPWRISIGYWQRPEATAEAWRNGWFHTGDMLFCDEDGYYFFADRKKDSLRRRGENISSFEVEREVMAYPDVLEVACVAAPGQFGDDEVKVFVVPRDGARLDPAGLIKFLIPRMPYFMVPRFVEIIDELPKTQSMRVKKFELRERGNGPLTWDREAVGIIVSIQEK
jgi:carnitine-CoA ligase